jgi:hypothetical protein
MSGFTMIVMANGAVSYVAGWHEDREAADKHATRMIDAVYLPDPEVPEDGEERFLFDGDEEIVIVDEIGQPVFAWSRHVTKSVTDYAGLDFRQYLDDEAKRNARKLIGFQFRSIDGENIQGTDEIPFHLGPNDVLRDGAVLTAKAWADDNFTLVAEVFSDDIEEPAFVTDLVARNSAAAAL